MYDPWKAECGRAYPRGHRLTAADRHEFPDAAFGLTSWERAERGGVRRPGRPGRWHKRRKYPMPDAVHAANAKSRATKALRRGHLTRSQYRRIMRKANAILERCGEVLEPVIPFSRRRPRVAANAWYEDLPLPGQWHESFRDPREEDDTVFTDLAVVTDYELNPHGRRLSDRRALDRIRSLLDWHGPPSECGEAVCEEVRMIVEATGRHVGDR